MRPCTLFHTFLKKNCKSGYNTISLKKFGKFFFGGQRVEL